MKLSEELQRYDPPLRITLIYAAVATLWILFSDYVVFRAIGHTDGLGPSLVKGTAFVLLTSWLLHHLQRRDHQKLMKAIEARYEKSAQYEALFTKCSAPMLLVDPDSGMVLDANEAAQKQYGYASGEFRKLQVAEVSQSSRESVARRLLETVATGSACVEAIHRRKDGTPINVEIHTSTLRSDGRMLIIAVIIDVTDRRRAESKIAFQEALLRTLSEVAPDGIIATDAVGHWLHWNDRFLQMWGIDRSYAEHRRDHPFSESDTAMSPLLAPVADPESFQKSSGRIYRNETDTIADRVHFLDGRVFDRISSPFHLEGSYRGRAWYCRDISPHVHLQRQLEKSVDMLRGVVDSAPLAIFTIDKEHQVGLWNKQAEVLFGIPGAGARGDALALLEEAIGPQFHGLLDRVLGGERLDSVRVQSADGRDLCLSLSAAPLHAEETGSPVGAIVLLADLTAQQQAERRLIQLATRDSLTGLLNRSSFQDAVARAVTEAGISGEVFSILYLDLDNFKTVNDSLGHDMGDRLLVAFGRTLMGLVRGGDVIGRLGGDEFAVLQRRLQGPTASVNLAKRILKALDKPLPIEEGMDLPASVSIGLAVYPQDGEDGETLLKSADVAMYEAKRKGRRSWSGFTRELSDAVRQRHEIEVALDNALERGELYVVYQPQVLLVSHRVVGFEALLRWESPTRGNVPPGIFIPIAESSGLIRRIGAWVLEQGCLLAAQLTRKGRGDLRISVNLSFAQLSDPALVETVADILERTQANPAQLELELTESMLASEPNRAVQVIDALAGMGLHLAIDDFGTGYSSLSYLRLFRVNRLKVDRSFTSHLHDEEGARTIVRASIALAQNMNMSVVAEGVETHEQADFLRAAGCQSAQGYLFGKPMPVADLWRLIELQPGDEATSTPPRPE